MQATQNTHTQQRKTTLRLTHEILFIPMRKEDFWLSICYTLEFVQHYYLSSKIYGSIGPTTKYVQTILEGIAFGNSKLNNRFDATILIRRAQFLSYTHCSDILSACFIFQDLIINLELN